MSLTRPVTTPAIGLSGSYAPEDVTFLLQPLELQLIDIEEKERLIQSGRRHYSEMLSPERAPAPQYMALYEAALQRNGARLAGDIAALAGALAARAQGRPEIVIASLARAGTPIGVLLSRALRRRGLRSVHYSISIIRDRGIDAAALAYIRARHAGRDVVFVDGWTGKGVIARELRASQAAAVLGAPPFLAVVADPAGAADLAATGEDYVIPSGLLNGIASGLVSRSIYDRGLIERGGFHGCVLLRDLADADVSRAFVGTVDAAAPREPVEAARWTPEQREDAAASARALVSAVASACGVADLNRIKPGVAEATRAVLRRVPERLFVKGPRDPEIAHLLHLASERNLAVEAAPPDSPFRAVAVIRPLGAE